MEFNIIRFKTILIFIALMTCSSCNGQNPSHNDRIHLKSQKLSTSLGRTVPEMDKGIMIVFQDRNDKYWFGSNKQGVYKYNNGEFTHFSMRDGLCSNQIWEIQQDNSGNMYFVTNEGISKFDGQTFTTLTLVDEHSPSNEWKLEPDDLWFKGKWNQNGPYRYDGKSLYHLEFPKHELEDEFNLKYPNGSFSPYGVYSIYKDRQRNIWFGTATFGVCRYDGKTLSWISEDELTELDDGPSNGVRSIVEDKDGNFWFSNILHRYYVENTTYPNKGLTYKKLKGMAFADGEKEMTFPYFMSITDDKNGDLWIATNSEGVWRYDGKNTIHYPVKDGDANISTFSIYKDNQGILWLGTHKAGAYKFNGQAFEKFRP